MSNIIISTLSALANSNKLANKQTKQPKITNRYSGFTIIELLIVIVIIGILVAITAVAYTGLTKQAKIATTKTDLANIKKALEVNHIKGKDRPSQASQMEDVGLSYLMSKARFFESDESPYDLKGPNIHRGEYLLSANVQDGHGGDFYVFYWNYEMEEWWSMVINIYDGSEGVYSYEYQSVFSDPHNYYLPCKSEVLNQCQFTSSG